jgi:hypothetical protein
MTPRAERLFEALRELVAIQSVSPDATHASNGAAVRVLRQARLPSAVIGDLKFRVRP